MDRETVMTWLEICGENDDCSGCCPYGNDGEPFDCRTKLMADAFVLLKEQEPVEPWLSYDGNEYHFHCTACDAVIYHNGANRDETKAREYAKFCRQCGRLVKWND